MRRLFYIFLLIGIFSLILPFSAANSAPSAPGPCAPGCDFLSMGPCPPKKPIMTPVSGGVCCCLTGRLKSPIGHKTFDALINAIIDFIFDIALVLAPLFIIIGGFYFMTAAGNPSKIETGKKIILYTLIGFLIIYVSRALIGEVTELIKPGVDQ